MDDQTAAGFEARASEAERRLAAIEARLNSGLAAERLALAHKRSHLG